ncbi:MAG: insulinase family protein [Burkholderiaceae bacterium]|jgi:zinc protease|nr:insulinase family protein [Burkholderiaceae bacterium]
MMMKKNTLSAFCRVGCLGALLLFAAQMPLFAAVTIESWVTKNGAKVFFVETHAIPVLDIGVDFDAGARRDPPGKAGLASLTHRMLARGITASEAPLKEDAMTEAQISDTFADVGAERSGEVGMDRAGVTLRILSSPKESARAIRVLARVMAQPAFPAELLARDQKRAISALRESLTQPETIAARAFAETIYGAHPYAVAPTPESLGALTRDDMLAFHKRYYVAQSAVVTIVGDASRARAEAMAEEISMRLVPLPAGEKLPAMPEVPAATAHEKRIAHPATQSHILVGMPALRRGDPDFFPLVVGNYILGGGGFVSRLMQEVREKRGLSYSVFSRFEPRLQKGPFVIKLQTRQAQTDEALGVVREVFNAFMRDGPTEAELKAAQDNLAEGFPLRLDNNAKVLALTSMIGYYGLPTDYLNNWTARVRAVKVGDIRAAFARKLSDKTLSTVIVGAEKPQQ